MDPNYVTSLELSQKLQEVGVPQKSEFWWAKIFLSSYENKNFYGGWHLSAYNPSSHDVKYSAFLASELMEMLPRNVSISQYDDKNSVRYCIDHDEGYMKPKHYQYDNLLSNALAKMVLYLTEKGVLKWEKL